MADPYIPDLQDPDSDTEVSIKDLISFIKAKNYSCEICGNRTWFSATAPDGLSAVSHLWKPAFLADSGYDFVFYPLICLDCGNTKSFHKLLVKFAINELRDEALKKLRPNNE